MQPYTDLQELAGIVLEESYVLGIRAEPGRITFAVDFLLTEAHPAYVPPPPSEIGCFGHGELRLMGVRRLVWDDQGAPPATDATGEADFGHIDTFQWDESRFTLEGDWGTLDALADSIEVSVERPSR